MLQPRAFGSLNRVETLDSVSIYYLDVIDWTPSSRYLCLTHLTVWIHDTLPYIAYVHMYLQYTQSTTYMEISTSTQCHWTCCVTQHSHNIVTEWSCCMCREFFSRKNASYCCDTTLGVGGSNKALALRCRWVLHIPSYKSICTTQEGRSMGMVISQQNYSTYRSLH